MRLPRLGCFIASTVLLLTYMTAPGYGGLITIDNFDSNVLDSAWVQSNAHVHASANATVTYSTTTNDNKLTHSFTAPTNNNNHTQTTLLRDDVSLANDGDYLQVTVRIPPITGTESDVLGGLALDSATKTPGTRATLYSLQLLGYGAIRAEFAGTNYGTTPNDTFAEGAEVVLRITRESPTTVTPSYSLDGGSNFTVLSLGSNLPPHNIGGFHSLGFIVGNSRFRTPATVVFDDLVMNIVPEPSGLYLASFGCIAGLRFARGRKG